MMRRLVIEIVQLKEYQKELIYIIIRCGANVVCGSYTTYDKKCLFVNVVDLFSNYE